MARIYSTFTLIKKWLIEEHLDNFTHIALAHPREEVIAAILAKRSIKPTPVAEALMTLPDVRLFFQRLLEGSPFINYCIKLEERFHRTSDDVIFGVILDCQFCHAWGVHLQKTPFWQEVVGDIKDQQRHLKKVDKIMRD
jgi:hypothetical protein